MVGEKREVGNMLKRERSKSGKGGEIVECKGGKGRGEVREGVRGRWGRSRKVLLIDKPIVGEEKEEN